MVEVVELAHAGDPGGEHLAVAGLGDPVEPLGVEALEAAPYIASRQLQKSLGSPCAPAVGGAADRPLEGVAVGVDEPRQEEATPEIVAREPFGGRRRVSVDRRDDAVGVDLDRRRGDEGAVEHRRRLRCRGAPRRSRGARSVPPVALRVALPGLRSGRSLAPGLRLRGLFTGGARRIEVELALGEVEGPAALGEYPEAEHPVDPELV